MQEPVPEQAPLQPVKAEPAAGLAARLTTAPDPNVAEQLVPQLIPTGVLDTVPVPVPDLLTFSVNVGTNVAETATSEVNVTVHEPVPEQTEPLQPANTDPDAATGVKVTAVPELKAAAQDAPQLMPTGALVMVPAPAPLKAMDRLNWGVGAAPKFAITFWSLLSDTVQPPVPEHAPPQPVNTKPWAGLTVTATFAPETKLVEQLLPQEIPAGLVATRPPFDGTG